MNLTVGVKIKIAVAAVMSYSTLRAYPNRILFQAMMPQAKCSIAS